MFLEWAVPSATSLCTELTVLLTQSVVTPPVSLSLALSHTASSTDCDDVFAGSILGF